MNKVMYMQNIRKVPEYPKTRLDYNLVMKSSTSELITIIKRSLKIIK